MKITFMGTSAGEGYPGFFCDCEYCTYARKHGGRNLRLNTSTLIDDDTMLDMNDGTPVTAAALGYSLTRVKRLLVTHFHDDHISPRVLQWRANGGTDENVLAALNEEARLEYVSARFTKVDPIDIYGNRNTRHGFMREHPEFFDEPDKHKIRFHEIIEGQCYQSGDIEFIPVRANHVSRGFAHSYILKRNGKTLLYALDTGGYDEDMMTLLHAQRYDAMIMEGTFGAAHTGGDHHMNLWKNIAFRDDMKAQGCISDETPFYLTHMAPHWTPPYDLYKDIAGEKGFIVAYDGMQVEI